MTVEKRTSQQLLVCHSHWQHDGWTSWWTYPFFMISFLVTHKYKWKQIINIVMYDSYTHLRAAAHKWDWLVGYLKYCLLASIMLSCQLRASNYVTETATRTKRAGINVQQRDTKQWNKRLHLSMNVQVQQQKSEITTVWTVFSENTRVSVAADAQMSSSLFLDISDLRNHSEVLFRPTHQKCYPNKQQEQWWKQGDICYFVCSKAKSSLSIASYLGYLIQAGLKTAPLGSCCKCCH